MHTFPDKPVLYRYPINKYLLAQYINTGMHCATIHTVGLTIIRFPLILLTTAYEWLASVCRDDGFLLATICCLSFMRLFRIAIIEATHFSDANLA